LEKYLPLLKKTALFEELREEDIGSMLKCLNAYQKEYKEGGMIWGEGETVGSVGIVLEGRVQVVREDVHGSRIILTEWGPGNLFAEAFAPAGIKEIPVSVFASVKSRILFLDFGRIITQCSAHCVFHSQLIRNMMRVIARKNLILNQRIELLGKRSIREKLLSYFWAEQKSSKRTRIALPFNRNELADYLCVDRSAMSRVLGQMRREGIVSFKKNVFELHLKEADGGTAF
jgi:CRP-like cAMP-binding protein